MDAERQDALIDTALEKRGFSLVLKPRIQALLSGREDRQRLRCCHSGCFVCVQELLAILTEVEGDADQKTRVSAPPA